MQAYLSDLTWESNLFSNLHALSAKIVPAGELRREEAPHPERELGIAWTEPGNPTLDIEVTDLGQIEVSMLWTHVELPTNAEAVTGPFLAFLQRLDPPPARRAP
jgi:hypothetical protein